MKLDPARKNRSLEETPSTIENVLAFTWLLIRRLVCFTAAIVFFFAAIGMLISGHNWHEKLFGFGICLMMAWSFAWIGTYGQSHRGYSKNNIAIYEKQKERYKWWWW